MEVESGDKASKKYPLILRSRKVFIEDKGFVNGVVVIGEDGKILEASSVENAAADDYPVDNVIDYGEYYIIPGGVDINVFLNSTYHKDWEDIQNVTEMMARGGITTIMEVPEYLDEALARSDDERLIAATREEKLEGNLYVDCGLIGFLSSLNMEMIPEILEHCGYFALKAYLVPPFQTCMAKLQKDDLATALESVENWMKEHDGSQFPILLHPEYAEERIFSVATPYRRAPIEERSNPYFKTKKPSLFADGYHNKNEEKFEKKKPLQETSEVPVEQEEEGKEEDAREDDQQYLHDLSPNIEALGRHIKKNSERNHLESIVNAEKMLYADSSPESEGESKDDQLSLTLNGVFSPPEISSESEAEKEDDQKSQVSLPLSNNLSVHTNSGKKKSPEALRAAMRMNRIKPGLLELKKIPLADGEKDACIEHIPPPMNIQPELLEKRLRELKEESEKGELVHCQSGLVEQTTQKLGAQDYRRKSENPKSSLLIRRTSISPERPPGLLSVSTLDSKVFNVSEIGSNQVLSGTESIPSTRQPMETGKCSSPDPAKSYTYFLATRPIAWEKALLKIARKAAKKKDCVKVVLMNVSHSETVYALKCERTSPTGQNLFVDTSLPYLYFHDKRIVKRATAFKGSPPIRDKTNRMALIHEVLLDCIDSVSSYHCSVPDKLKFLREKNFSKAVNGYQSAGHNLRGLWTVVAMYSYLKNGRKMGLSLSSKDLIADGFPGDREEYEKLLALVLKVVCSKPAELIGIGERKGQIKQGFDADIVIFEPFCWSKDKIATKNPKSALFQDETLLGKIHDVYLRGSKIVSNSKCLPMRNGLVLKRSFKHSPQLS